MLKSLIIFLLGQCILVLNGSSADRLINICSKNNLKIWGVSKKDGRLTLHIYRKDYKKLLGFAEKTDTDIEISEQKGLPFLIKKYKKRKCFVVGFLMFVFLVWKYTTFVWDINVCGEAFYSEEEIEKNIKENYVTLGSRVKDVDCHRLEEILRDDYPEISWISCELKGTQLNVTLTETIKDDIITNQTVPGNIVSAYDCIITDVLVKSGVAVVEQGAEVKKGDILITGAVNIYNEYDELIETNYVPAAGIVYGQITRSYSDEFDMNHYIKNYTDKRKTYYSFFLRDTLYEPCKPEINYVNYDVMTNYKKIQIFDSFYIPIAIEKTVVSEYEPELSVYTEDEAKEKAKKKLNVYLGNLRKKGVEILENNVKIKIKDGKCYAEGTIITREPIGIFCDIPLFEQGEEKDQ